MRAFNKQSMRHAYSGFGAQAKSLKLYTLFLGFTSCKSVPHTRTNVAFTV